MIALIQRVNRAEVRIDDRVSGSIGQGLLALVGVVREDDDSSAARLLERVLGFRVFADGDGRMNRSVADVAGGLLLVPQFTLAAGTRAGFSTAAEPVHARALFERFVERARATHPHVATGEFGAHMRVLLENDGPVTFWLES